MSELYFRLGEMKGFTAIELADKKEGYANPIRELMQNSLDASRDAGNSECEINIYIETISKQKIPRITEYEKVLEKAIQIARDQGSFNANSQQRVKSIKSALEEKNPKIMMFSDNGIGMNQEQLEAILTGGVSIKGDEESGGSFGVGHLSSYSLSSLRYVLYATKYKNKDGSIKSLFTGSPILAGYRDERSAQRGNRGRIVLTKPEDEMDPKFVYPEEFPDFVKPRMESIDTGTIVTVLGLSENWGQEAEYAIVSNFFYAIAYDALSVNIHQDGGQRVISDKEVEQLIACKKDNQRAKGENILSGKAVYQAWQAVKENQKTIELSNSDKVHVCIKSDKNANSVIVLIRNGMVVARHDSMLSKDIDGLRKDPDFQPFTVVIDVDKHDAPKLFQLVKDAEGPYHNRLQTKILSSTDEKCLKELLKELSEGIKKHLNRIDRETFDLPVFQTPNQAEAQTGGNKRSSGQDAEGKEQIDSNKSSKRKKSKKGEGKNRPNPVVINRNLESKNAVQYTDNGNKWTVRLRVIPKNKADVKDEVYLSICLGEDNDDGGVKNYLDFITVKMNEQTIEIPEFVIHKKDKKIVDKSQVKLGSLEQGKQYNILAEVKKPDKIGDMKVALLPIFGLKQRKKTEG